MAVFLALAVGIFVGSSFIAGSSVERQVAKGLEREFGKLRTENAAQQQRIADLEARIKRGNDFCEAVAPVLTSGRLAGSRVAIIQTGDYADAGRDVRKAVERAGGLIVSVTTVPAVATDELDGRAKATLQKISGGSGDGSPFRRCLEILTFAVASGANPDAVSAMGGDGLATISGDYSRHVTAVVVLGGSRGEESESGEPTEGTVIDKLKSLSAITIVGAEPVETVISSVPTYVRKGVASVDNIDQPMGQVSLVYALLGDTGAFGVKQTADKSAPASIAAAARPVTR